VRIKSEMPYFYEIF
jgi:DNA-binding GntR family transcriptional regulator